MPSYPFEISIGTGSNVPSPIRLSVSSVLVALSLGEWNGKEIEEDEFEMFMSDAKVESGGREFSVYRSAHEFMKFVPSGNLARAVRDIQAMMLRSIDGGGIQPLSLRRALDGTIDVVETWLSTDSVDRWCEERRIVLHELFYEYIDGEQKIFEAGLTALDDARFRAENKSDFVSVDAGADGVDWQALYLDAMSKRTASTSEQSNRTDRSTHHQHPRQLGTRERNVLLCIVAALAKEANLDVSKPSKTAALICDIAHKKLGVAIGETTIEAHLKKIPDALETRAK